MSLEPSHGGAPTAGVPRREALSDGAYDVVKERIMDLDLAPGAQVNMEQLARDLQVSTTPLREALTRLEGEGLVIRRNLRGYVVTPQPTPQHLRDLFTVRTALEPVAASTAAATASEQCVASLRSALSQMKDCSDTAAGEQYNRYRALVDADALFHDGVAIGSGNQLLRRMLTSLHSHVLLYRLYFVSGVGPEFSKTLNEHRAVLDAIVAGDAASAAKAMRVHTERSKERVLRLTSIAHR